MNLLGALSRKKFAVIIIGYLAAIATYICFFTNGLHKDSLDEVQIWGSMVESFTALYGLLAGLTLISLWGSFNAIENHIRLEAGLLADVRRFARLISDESLKEMNAVLKSYLERVLGPELAAFKKMEIDAETEELFSKIITCAGGIVKRECKDLAVRSLADAMLRVLTLASQERDVRVSMSASSMPKPMMYLVHFHAFALLVMIFFSGFQHRFYGTLVLTTFSIALFMTYFAIIELDNPFRGVFNLDNSPFRKLLEKTKK